jgi:hypothetical protein
MDLKLVRSKMVRSKANAPYVNHRRFVCQKKNRDESDFEYGFVKVQGKANKV